MRPSLPALVRIVPRAAVFSRAPPPHSKSPDAEPHISQPPHDPSKPHKIRIVRAPPSHAELKKSRVTLIDIMTRRQKEGVAKRTWPGNLRVEPIVTSKTLSGLVPGAKGQLRRLLKER